MQLKDGNVVVERALTDFVENWRRMVHDSWYEDLKKFLNVSLNLL